MAANLFQPSLTRALDSNGNPVSGAKMYFYLTGTTTPATWFTDQAGTVAGTNPLTADSTGIFAPAYMDPDVTYRIVLKTSDGATTIWDVDPVRGFDETQLLDDAAAAAAAATGASASATAAQTAQTGAETARTGAEAARDAANSAAAASQDYFPGARSYVPQGAVTGAATISTAGSGGTNGTFDLAWTGGNFAVNPTGTFTVSGGAVTAITITGAGLYIGNALSKPTMSFAASTGLTGAAGAFNTVYLKTAGQYWLTDTSPASAYLALFQNQANAAVEIDAQFDPMSAGRASDEADLAAAAADDVTQSTGLGVSVINVLDLATAQADKTLNNSTGVIISGSGFSAFKITRVYPGQKYRFRKAVTYLAAFDASDVLIGSVVSSLAADTEWTAPSGTAYVNMAQTTSTLTKPRQMMVLTATSIASTPFASPYLTNVSEAHRIAFWDALKNIYASSPKSINLIDQSDSNFALGFALGTDGLPTANASYGVTGFIPIIGDGTQQYIGSHTTGVNGGSVYDENKVFLGTVTNPASTAWTPSVSLGACFYRQQFLLSGGAAPSGLGMVPGASLPSSMPTFGYLNSTSVTAVAVAQARLADQQTGADDRNVLNPNNIRYNRSISAVNGALSTTAGYSTTNRIPVNAGDFIAATVGTNAMAWFDINGTYLSTISAASVTASVSGNVLRVTAVGSGAVQAGQRILNGATVVGSVIRQITTMSGDVSTWLLDATATIASTTLTASQGVFLSNVWVPVPANAFFVEFQRPNLTELPTATVRQGRASVVVRATGTVTISGDQMTFSALTGQPIVGDLVTGPGITPGTKITAVPSGMGTTGAYTVSISQTVASATDVTVGASPVVVSKAFGGGGAVYPSDGISIGFFGNSQTNNGFYQASAIAATGGVQAFSKGHPGANFGSLSDTYFATDFPNAAALNNARIVWVTEGHNEWAAAVRPLGTIADASSVNSTYGKMRKILESFYALDPTLIVGFTGVTYRGYFSDGTTYNPDTTTNAQGLTGADIDAAIKEFCDDLGLPFADLRQRSGFNAYTDVNNSSNTGTKTWTADGLHWTALSGPRIGHLIAAETNRCM